MEVLTIEASSNSKEITLERGTSYEWQVISKSINVEPFYVLLGITVFVFGYMMFGGANSMVYTNTIQAIIMFIVAIILISSGAEYFEGGITGFFEKLSGITT